MIQHLVWPGLGFLVLALFLCLYVKGMKEQYRKKAVDFVIAQLNAVGEVDGANKIISLCAEVVNKVLSFNIAPIEIDVGSYVDLCERFHTSIQVQLLDARSERARYKEIMDKFHHHLTSRDYLDAQALEKAWGIQVLDLEIALDTLREVTEPLLGREPHIMIRTA